MAFNNGEHDDDITKVEGTDRPLERLADHLAGVADSLRAAVPLLRTLGRTDREYLAFALADEADELLLAAKDLPAALRTLGRS